ncbi:YitT family protein [Denitrovibrio acetiphilus]|nr:YitT family protein [Denitrovibrio acetiphilus]
MLHKILKDKNSPKEHRHRVSTKTKRLIIPKKFTISRWITQNFFIILGSAISALGYVLFQIPFDLAAGGITGLAIILHQYLPITTGMAYLLLNIPLVILGYFKLGKMKFLGSTLIAVITFYIFTDFFVIYLPGAFKQYPISQDLLLNAIYSGILFGIGMGIIYRAGGTLGGTSIPARILQQKMGYPLSQSYMFTDLSIIFIAGFIFSWEIAMLGVLALVLSGIVTDFVMEGSSQVRTAFIITKHPKVLSNTLMAELGRGVSTWMIKGGYTEADQTMVYCTVRRSQVSDLKYLVAAVDEKAFLVIGTAQQAWGGVGFNQLKHRKAD